MSRLQHLRPIFVTAALACFLGGLAVPAHADDRHWRGPPPRHGHHPPGWYPGYVAPAPIYTPPAVVYAPPAPVSPGISLVVPFNFR
jgi:hypothetical protein